MKRRPTFLITMLAFGFAFFYIPILSMIVYSFNASRLATVWGGFSSKWYVALFSDDKVIEALILSLKIAFVSATIALMSSSHIWETIEWDWLKSTPTPVSDDGGTGIQATGLPS